MAYGGFRTGHEAIIGGFVEAVGSGQPVPVSGQEGLATVETLERVVQVLADKYDLHRPVQMDGTA